MLTMVEYVHQALTRYDFDIAVDFTLGNGYDTKYLDELGKTVYSFDIQEVAIQHIKNQVSSRVHLICADHAHFDAYVKHFDVGIFNLGYLPGGDHMITTTLNSTKQAITKAVEMMSSALLIVVYTGHDEGKKESEWINDYVSSLDRNFNVSTYRMMNKVNSPYVIEIEKRK